MLRGGGMRRMDAALLVLLALALAPVHEAAPLNAWTLLWRDEFVGNTLNRNNWEPQIASGCQYDLVGWGNVERQWYTDLPENLFVQDGRLHLRALHNPTSATRPFTSARVRTFGKYSVAPSGAYPTIRIEARIRVPQGLGLWPAFWLLPEDGANAGCSGCGRYGTWAASGEIDIMELSNDMKQLSGTIHFGGPWDGNTYLGSTYAQPGGASFSDGAFHTYRLEWSRRRMRWFVDGVEYGSQVSGNGTRSGWFSIGPETGPDMATRTPLPGHAPFDRKFHLILNLALGSEGTAFTKVNGVGVTEEQLKATLAEPKTVEVDWVRVYGR